MHTVATLSGMSLRHYRSEADGHTAHRPLGSADPAWQDSLETSAAVTDVSRTPAPRRRPDHFRPYATRVWWS
jgi:hypothetical protein